MKNLLGLIFGSALFFLTACALADEPPNAAKPQLDKTPMYFTFHDAMPIKSGYDKDYCEKHSPSKLKSSLENLVTNGAVAKNGLLLKYKSFTNSSKYELFFTEITATLSGIIDEKQWQTDMFISEQKVDPTGNIVGVWATPECKGWVNIEK